MFPVFQSRMLIRRVARHTLTLWRPRHTSLPTIQTLHTHSSPRILSSTNLSPLNSDDRPSWTSPSLTRLLTTSTVLASKVSSFTRLKQMIKDYWYIIVPVEIVTSIGWYGAFFFSLRSGVDIIELLTNLGVSQQTLRSASQLNIIFSH